MTAINRILLLLLVICLLYSCRNKNDEQETAIAKTDKAEKNIKPHPASSYDDDLCMEKLKALMLSSNFRDSTFYKFDTPAYLQLSSINGDTITMGVKFETDGISHIRFGWYELRLKSEELYNITFDPENPILLTFDHKLLKDITHSCDPGMEEMNTWLEDKGPNR